MAPSFKCEACEKLRTTIYHALDGQYLCEKCIDPIRKWNINNAVRESKGDQRNRFRRLNQQL